MKIMKIFYIIIISVLFVSLAHADDPGSISVNTEPIGVDVYLDNQYQGLSPLNINNVIRGNHTLVFNKEGYNSAAINIFVESNVVFDVMVTLTPGQGGGLESSFGNIAIVTNPSNANLYLNRIYQGSTPMSIPNVAVGTHEIKVDLNGYYDFTQLVSVSAGETTSIYINLIPINQQIQTGSLRVTTNPAGADIRVNNFFVGSSPLIINNLPTGYHSIKASKDGYSDYTSTILIYNGLTSEINIQLSELLEQNNTIPGQNNSQGNNGAPSGASPSGPNGAPSGASPSGNQNSQNPNQENPEGAYENGVLIPERKPELFQSPESTQSLLLWIILLIVFIGSIVTLYIFISNKR